MQLTVNNSTITEAIERNTGPFLPSANTRVGTPAPFSGSKWQQHDKERRGTSPPMPARTVSPSKRPSPSTMGPRHPNPCKKRNMTEKSPAPRLSLSDTDSEEGRRTPRRASPPHRAASPPRPSPPHRSASPLRAQPHQRSVQSRVKRLRTLTYQRPSTSLSPNLFPELSSSSSAEVSFVERADSCISDLSSSHVPSSASTSCSSSSSSCTFSTSSLSQRLPLILLFL